MSSSDRFNVPEPEPSDEELAEAARFAAQLDVQLTAGTSVAGSDELVELAVAIRAAGSSTEAQLGAASRTRIVEAALAQAMRVSPAAATPITSLAEARARRNQRPWALLAVTAVLAAAAVALLIMRTPSSQAPAINEPTATAAPSELPLHWQSRPADRVVGQIDPANAADADVRIDLIFADRLDGYRERQLSNALRGTP